MTPNYLLTSYITIITCKVDGFDLKLGPSFIKTIIVRPPGKFLHENAGHHILKGLLPSSKFDIASNCPSHPPIIVYLRERTGMMRSNYLH